MKKIRLLSILSIIVLLFSCSSDNTDLDNLVGTKWKDTAVIDDSPSREYGAIFFKTGTTYQSLFKYVGEAEEVEEEAQYLVNGGKIIFKYEDGSILGEGTINKNVLVLTFVESGHTTTYVKE